MTTLNYGLIGCGMMGREHLRNVALLGDARVAAIFEPDDAMAAEASAIAPEAERVGSLEGMLARDDLDALVIVSPNHVHAEQLTAIAQARAARPLPILCEKPIVIDEAQWAALNAVREGYGAPIWVAMEYRYMPPVAALLRGAEAATGGIDMLTIREHRFPFLVKVGHWNRLNRRTGGTLVEKCCHFFDLMRLALRAEPVRVMASAGQVNNHRDEDLGGERADVWDSAYVIVDFDTGARAMLELCMYAEGSRYQEEISAVGRAGKIECLVPGPTRFWPDDLGEPPTPQVIVSPREPKGPRVVDVPVDPELLEAGDHNGSTFYQHRRFRDVVRGTGTVEVTLEDGWRAVRMGLAAQESARTGEAVRL